MKLHDLKPQAGSKKNRKRVGRGIAAGQGKTAGRGTKGCLLYTSPSPRDATLSRMPSSA